MRNIQKEGLNSRQVVLLRGMLCTANDLQLESIISLVREEQAIRGNTYRGRN